MLITRNYQPCLLSSKMIREIQEKFEEEREAVNHREFHLRAYV